MMSGGTRKKGDIVGDYHLTRAANEGQMTRTWEAEQISMQRPVMLEMLKALAAQDERVVKAFLEDVRAKALVTHPGVGAVYEAVANQEATFFSRERMDGDNLEEIYQTGRKFTPLEVVVLLQQIADAMLYLEGKKAATVDFSLHHFIVVGENQIRLMNLAVEGVRDGRVDTRTKALLGEFFEDVLKQGLPGATRVKSLCSFMYNLERPIPVTWRQIADLCQQVRDQLEGTQRPEPAIVAEAPYQPKKSTKIPASVWALLGGVGLIGGLILWMVFGKERDPEVPSGEKVEVAELIPIPQGLYKFAGDREVEIRDSFSIGRAEVTLSDYHTFLEAPNLEQFGHPDQPKAKKDYLPDDWEQLWRAAVKGEKWQDRTMSLGCPVIGIDWWDAYAYANWQGGRLPTLMEWMAASVLEGAPSQVSSWGKAGDESGDVTGAGLAGMAGNVREWTAQPEINPVNPLAPKSYVAAGGSFEESGEGIATRLWLESRNARRGDLGFRVIGKK